MSYQNVHSPLDDPPSYFFSDSQLQLISSLDNPFERSYAMSLVALDWSVQKIYEQLEENNMLDDTLIVFASDNGGCSLGGGFNFPLRGDKVSLFEGGVLVNAFVWSNSQTIIPQHLRGTTYDNLFHVTDWLPTIVGGMLGRVDILPPNLDGSDQWNAMMQRTTEVPRSEILLNIDNYEGSADHQRGIIVDKLKMIYDYDIGYSEPSALSEPESAMNSSYGVIDCILGTHYTFKQFVFNLEDDPYEQTNLAMTIDSTILKELAERLSSYYGSVTDPCWSDELSDAEDELLVQQYNKMLDAWETSGGVVPWASDPYMSCHF
jgi:arylsulfatase A-like enzyme